jgi:hypothetical protein
MARSFGQQKFTRNQSHNFHQKLQKTVNFKIRELETIFSNQNEKIYVEANTQLYFLKSSKEFLKFY